MTSRDCSRKGFTLIELLVVIAIIAVLIALLLPAVQQAREAARRTQCRNNLKQQALALHNYHDVFSIFPPGRFSEASGTQTCIYQSQLCRTTWAIAILPYMEQANLNNLYDTSIPNFFAPNDTFCQQKVPSYQCPSDTLAGTIASVRGWGTNCTISSYRAVGGVSRIPAEGAAVWTWSNCEINIPPATSNRFQDSGLLPCAGVGNAKVVKIAFVTDGTSNTFALGESMQTQRSLNPAPPRPNERHATFWAHSAGTGTISQVVPDSRIFLTDWAYCTQLSPSLPWGDAPCRNSFGSLHTGGTHFARADGSASFVSHNVNVNLFVNLCTIGGGETGSID